MPSLSRVIDNTRRSDGTIESTVRVNARIQSVAVNKAKTLALLENGYSDTVLDTRIGAEIIDVSEGSRAPLKQTYDVTVLISGSGEYFSLN